MDQVIRGRRGGSCVDLVNASILLEAEWIRDGRNVGPSAQRYRAGP
jgi:hypothetical protein